MKKRRLLALLVAIVLTLGLVFVPNYSATNAAGAPSVTYRSFVQTYGWLPWVENGKLSGKTGEAKRLECIQIKLGKQPVTGSVKYRSYVQGKGWTAWVQDGEKSGIQGESRRIESMQIKLTGKMAQQYDIYYRVHVQSFGWLAWAKNGETAGTAGVTRRIEGIQIKLVDKGAAAPGNVDNIKSSKSSSFIGKAEGTEILCKNAYSSLVNNISSKCRTKNDNYISVVFDLDRDGVPELLILPSTMANQAVKNTAGVYALVDGKAQNVAIGGSLKAQYVEKLKKIYSDTTTLLKDAEISKLVSKLKKVCDNYGIDSLKLLAGDTDELGNAVLVVMGLYDQFSKSGKLPEIKGLDFSDLPVAIGNKSADDVLELINNIKITTN